MMTPLVLLLVAQSAKASRAKRHVVGAAKVLAYLGAVSAAFGVVVAHKAHADVGGKALSLGRELASSTQGLEGGYTAVLNGQRFQLGETTTDARVSEVLDAAQATCEASPGALGGLFAQMPEKGTLKGVGDYHLEGSFRHGIIRNGTEKDGVVVCFEGDPAKPRGAAEALAAFATSQDLGELGKLRYVYAKHEPDGKTRVTVARTGEHFSLKAIAEGGEKEGHDGAVPRPEGARRVLTAELEGVSQTTNVYLTDAPVATVAAHYDSTLGKAGFVRVTPPAADQTLRVFSKEGFEVIVAIRKDEEKTVLAVTESRPGAAKKTSKLEVLP
ncbi:MAG: hypothetical protein U0183_03745 [Polyangiaceae bacterium]